MEIIATLFALFAVTALVFNWRAASKAAPSPRRVNLPANTGASGDPMFLHPSGPAFPDPSPHSHETDPASSNTGDSGFHSWGGSSSFGDSSGSFGDCGGSDGGSSGGGGD